IVRNCCDYAVNAIKRPYITFTQRSFGWHQLAVAACHAQLCRLERESLKVSKILVLSRSGMLAIIVEILPINPFVVDGEADRPRPLPGFDKDRTVGFLGRVAVSPGSSVDTRRRRRPALPLRF